MDLRTDGALRVGPPDSVAFHIPALDGLRAIAALLVFADHAIPAPFPVIGRFAAVGWSGVTVFFCLSGFLVTTLLLREEARSAAAGGPLRFSVLRFWARRSLRIWPLYFLALLVAFVAVPALPGPWNLGVPSGGAEHGSLVADFALPSSVFMMNWATIAHGWPSTPFGVLWSVSIEEQLYVLLPLCLLVCPRTRRRSVLVVLALGSFAWQSAELFHRNGDLAYYLNTFMCAHSFLVGAIFADVLSSRGGVVCPAPRWVPIAVPAIYVLHAILPVRAENEPALALLRYGLLDAMAAGAIWCCLPGGPWSRALAWRPAAALGRISYGFYVWHRLVLAFLGVAVAQFAFTGSKGVLYAVSAVVALAATVAIAWVSYRWFERPFLNLKARFAA